MINFRYHVISIVAVFLALGLGIVMGSTVIDRAIVDGLRNRIDNAEQNSIDRKAENDRLRSSIEQQDAQDTVLAPHTVENVLTGQTVFVVSIGNVPDDIRVETRELLAVSGARMGSEVDLNEDFVTSDKTKISKELNAIPSVKALLVDEKNKDAQVATVLQSILHRRAGGTTPEIDVEQATAVLNNYNVFSEKEQATSFDPVQPVSFVFLVNRTELSDKKISSFVGQFSDAYPVSIGFVGSETDVPSRSNAIELLGESAANFMIVDNAESPSGRATLVLAHLRATGGERTIFGISSKAVSPAPDLGS